MHTRPYLSVAVLLANIVTSCRADRPVQPPVISANVRDADTAKPISNDFPQRSPAEAGIEQAALDTLISLARQSDSDALVLVDDGHLVGEWYFEKDVEPIEAMSVTKSIVSLAIGMLIDDGKIASLDASVHIYFPQWADGPKSKINIRHLLAHTTGLKARSNTKDIYASDDFVKFGLDSEVEAEPGVKTFYNNRAFNILAGVVEKASGQRMDKYLQRRLFKPLGITDASWALDRAGNPHAMAGLQIRPLDLAKIGQLMLDQGMWRGKRILSQRWIAQSVLPARKKFPKLGLSWWLLSVYKLVIDDEVIGEWRKAGLDPQFVDKVLPMKGRVLSRKEFLANLNGSSKAEPWTPGTITPGVAAFRTARSSTAPSSATMPKATWDSTSSSYQTSAASSCACGAPPPNPRANRTASSAVSANS
jgi:CubicO group peptidase (beta-lactamase class C family)